MTRTKRYVLAGLLSVMAGCGGGGSAPARPAKLQVTATIFPLADWMKEVGGDDAEVHCLVSGSSNPHHYEPSTRDALTISESRALFAVGLGLDPWASKLAKNAGKSDVEYIETGAWIMPRKFGATTKIGEEHDEDEHEQGKEHAEEEHGHSHEAGAADPHFWHDPQRAITVVKKLAAELGRMDPAHKDAYIKRAEEYAKKLTALDEEMQKTATQIPAGSSIVTFHDAYGYLFERLKIRLAAVVQVSPGVEPSLKDVAEAVKTMKEIGQTVVFREPQESGAAAQRVADELKATVEVLDPMDSETSPAGKTYIERFRGNLQRLQAALSKSVDEKRAK
jgi:ABC-type Zn uptake system ZnuABC Zn-binding protein ZnuA